MLTKLSYLKKNAWWSYASDVIGMPTVCARTKYSTVYDSYPSYCTLLCLRYAGIADRVKNFAVLYVCDLDQVPDFKQMYELYDPVTLMFFFRNKHMVCS